jgi:hypothetical protein
LKRRYIIGLLTKKEPGDCSFYLAVLNLHYSCV